MPAVTESRLADFTELVATAIANADAREQVTRLAEEQAALRRVATLVAEGARPRRSSRPWPPRCRRCSAPIGSR